jgi:hypothetical protein
MYEVHHCSPHGTFVVDLRESLAKEYAQTGKHGFRAGNYIRPVGSRRTRGPCTEREENHTHTT